MPPRNKGNRKSNSKNPADWNKFDFVEIRLDEKQKADFKKRYSDNSQALFSLLDEYSKNGYKVSLTYDENNSCTIASFTCREPSDVNFNYVLTARAGDVWEALALLIYKHTYACDDGDWGADESASSSSWG